MNNTKSFETAKNYLIRWDWELNATPYYRRKYKNEKIVLDALVESDDFNEWYKLDVLEQLYNEEWRGYYSEAFLIAILNIGSKLKRTQLDLTEVLKELNLDEFEQKFFFDEYKAMVKGLSIKYPNIISSSFTFNLQNINIKTN